MLKSIEATGSTRDIAIQNALDQLKLDRDSVSVEVLDNGKTGFLGIGSRPARVRVTYDVPEEKKPAAPAQKPAAPTASAPAASKPAAKVPAASAPVARPSAVNAAKQESQQAPQKSAPPAGVDANDPRLTTPHLVKPAPKKEGGEAAAAAPQSDRPRRERNDRFERNDRGDRNDRFDRNDRPRRERRPRPELEKPPVSVPHEDKPIIPVSEEAMQKAAQDAAVFIDGLLKEMGVEGHAVQQPTVYADQLRMEIVGSDMGPVIGRRGDTLDAIQYLTSLVINKETTDHIRLSLDTENYREKRSESLERLARKMAGKVVKYHKPMTLEPMNPFERRIIHSTLQDYRGVTTYSTGTEPGRRVVIAPEGGYARRYPSRGGSNNHR
jgi:spoIIIJ-associated protein